MEELIETFFEMDKDNNEIVDKDELVNHCKDKKLDMKMVDQWISKCDVNKDNKITFDEFCRGFGIKLVEMRVEKVERALIMDDSAPKLPDDVQVIGSVMSLPKQIEVIRLFKACLADVGKDRHKYDQLSQKVKQGLEKEYGRVWHVVVLDGSFWMSFSHEPFMSLQFKHANLICLLWRTPGGN